MTTPKNDGHRQAGGKPEVFAAVFARKAQMGCDSKLQPSWTTAYAQDGDD